MKATYKRSDVIEACKWKIEGIEKSRCGLGLPFLHEKQEEICRRILNDCMNKDDEVVTLYSNEAKKIGL